MKSEEKAGIVICIIALIALGGWQLFSFYKTHREINSLKKGDVIATYYDGIEIDFSMVQLGDRHDPTSEWHLFTTQNGHAKEVERAYCYMEHGSKLVLQDIDKRKSVAVVRFNGASTNQKGPDGVQRGCQTGSLIVMPIADYLKLKGQYEWEIKTNAEIATAEAKEKKDNSEVIQKVLSSR